MPFEIAAFVGGENFRFFNFTFRLKRGDAVGRK